MKRALIITYYWPPAGGPGVQRWLKFVTYFKEFGIEPILYTPSNPNYPIVDQNLINEVPPNVLTIKQPIKEPYRFAGFLSKKKTKQMSSGIISKTKPSLLEKAMLWVRGNFFIPDARIGWVQPSVNYLKDYINQNHVDIIITTGPPHSLHLIGMELKRQLKISWISDFRDPWTTIHYHKSLRLSKVSERKHKKLEFDVLNNSDRIVVTSFKTKEEFSEITNQPIEVITNGYDKLPPVFNDKTDRFTLSHIGSLLSERNPKILWEVLAELCLENTEFKKDLLIKLIGTVSQDIINQIKQVGLDSVLSVDGYLPHDKAIEAQTSSQVLLLIEMDLPETRAIIPGKLFEYLAARRPILALGPEGSDVESIINETNSGAYFGYTHRTRLKKQLLTYYQAFKNNQLDAAKGDSNMYSRKELTKKMAALIYSME